MKEKKQKVYKGMTAPVDVHLDIPEDEIWSYKIDGLAEPHINKPFTNFTLKKVVFTVLLVIAVFISMQLRPCPLLPESITMSHSLYIIIQL